MSIVLFTSFTSLWYISPMLKQKTVKLSIILFFSLLAFCGGIGTIVYRNAGYLLAKALSEKTQTPVTIDHIEFHKGAVTLKNLVIGNTQRAYIPTAFRAEAVDIDTSYSNYLKNPVVIDKIEMHNVYIDIEFFTEDKEEGNWQALIENMAVTHEDGDDEGRRADVKKLSLNNVHVTLILEDGKIHRLSPISHLEFDDVTSDNGILLDEVSAIIAHKMMVNVLREEGLNLIIKIPLKVIKKLLPFLP